MRRRRRNKIPHFNLKTGSGIAALLIFVVFQLIAAYQESAAHEMLTGAAHISDGDSITIAGQRIRLLGIDAPEMKQQCYRDSKPYACGKEAKHALEQFVAGRVVSCNIESQDRYQRHIAECYAGELNLNAQMVASGHALAYRHYSTRYVSQEESARAQRFGMHGARYTEPWEWRKSSRRK